MSFALEQLCNSQLQEILHICSLDDMLLISLDYYCHCFSVSSFLLIEILTPDLTPILSHLKDDNIRYELAAINFLT